MRVRGREGGRQHLGRVRGRVGWVRVGVRGRVRAMVKVRVRLGLGVP